MGHFPRSSPANIGRAQASFFFLARAGIFSISQNYPENYGEPESKLWLLPSFKRSLELELSPPSHFFFSFERRRIASSPSLLSSFLRDRREEVLFHPPLKPGEFVIGSSGPHFLPPPDFWRNGAMCSLFFVPAQYLQENSSKFLFLMMGRLAISSFLHLPSFFYFFTF